MANHFSILLYKQREHVASLEADPSNQLIMSFYSKEMQVKQQFKGKEEFSQQVNTFILNYIKSKQIALGEVENEDLNDVENEVVDDEDFYKPDEKPEAPLHIKYATQVSLI